MKPNISEFSYGYALTDELVHWHNLPITAAPVFPSLYDEGRPGGGYDVKLNKDGIPLFIQFKLSHCMVRNTAMEVREGAISSVPFYRMHIRARQHSDQHDMLLALEAEGNEVYYSAPAFHEPSELDDAYINHKVKERSLWIEPSSIGSFADDGAHHVAFNLGDPVHVCSKPRLLDVKGSYDEFTEHVISSFNDRASRALSREPLLETVSLMRELSTSRREFTWQDRQASEDGLADRHPLQQMAFFAHVYFDVQLFVVTTSD
jgi:hypothetical protein